ncbi:hypothetical protein L7F22_054735 [Adiantum nelumboides]|nr:hypothetical protein [Adiantum nelumboides]
MKNLLCMEIRKLSQRKKKGSTEPFSSHILEFFMDSRQRKPKGRPRHIHFDNIDSGEKFVQGKEDVMQEVGNDKDNKIDPTTTSLLTQEVEIPREQWALPIMLANCVRKCFAKLGRKNCNTLTQSRDKGLVAPSIWSERTYQDKSIAQWLWFCNHDVKHTKVVKKQVKISIDVPTLWPVARGTNVLDEEVSSLRAAGFRIASVSTPLQTPPTTNICTSTPELGSGSRKRKWRHGISKEAQNRIEASNKLDMTLLKEIVLIQKQHGISSEEKAIKLSSMEQKKVESCKEEVAMPQDIEKRFQHLVNEWFSFQKRAGFLTSDKEVLFNNLAFRLQFILKGSVI